MTLKPGEHYDKLRTTHVIFFCTFDPFCQGKGVYDFDFHDRKTRTIRFDTGMHIKVFNSTSQKYDLSPAIQSFLDYMNGVIDSADSYIEQLQKDLDYYVDSGEWNYDMDKYQAILDETARKAAEKAAKKAKKEATKNTIISYIKYRKQQGDSLANILKNALVMGSEQLTSSDIENLVKKNY